MKEWFAKARFGSFAYGHFLLSFVWFFLSLTLMTSYGADKRLSVSLTVLGMLSYVPIGWGLARRRGWVRRSGRIFALSVLLPAFFAWLWGGLAILSLLQPSALEELGLFLAALLCGSLVLLAAPSAGLGALCLSLSSPLPDFVVIGGAVFAAGLLPPLLFWAGGWIGSRPANSAESEPVR